MKLFKDLIQEIGLVFSGKSLDIIIPPILFVLLLRFSSLEYALVGSLVLSIVFLVIRIKKQDNLLYAIGGFVGVLFASVIAILDSNASNFFLPDLVATLSLIIITLISLFIHKPLALWVSHITRGWELDWFNRTDVKPAYTEVTIFWLIFFIVRFTVELVLYFQSTVEQLAFANVILGLPVTLLVLTISYIYGIWRLHNMKGPGVEEFREGKEAPYKGQTRGF